MQFNKEILKIKNLDQITDNLENFINDQIFNKFKRHGAVVGISGGIDSAVTLALCVKALGSENVLGIILPEKDSNPKSELLAKNISKKLGVRSEIVNITPILESFNVYKIRDSIVKKNFPEYSDDCKYRIVLPNDLLTRNSLTIPYLEILDSNNHVNKIKLPLKDYSTLTAATTIKHRVRMTMLHFHAESNHFLVMGTTNKSEFIQGYFVKYGDGGVDVELLTSLYKTQVYQLANHLKIPQEIIDRKASPDTWSFEVSDEEFFYSIPYQIIDLLWYAREKNIPIKYIEKELDLTEEQINRVFDDQQRKWNMSKHLREMPPNWNEENL